MYRNKRVPVMKIFGLIASILLLGLFAACKKNQSVLEINPVVGDAGKALVMLNVSWDVRPFGLTGGYIEVNNLGQPPKLWTGVGASGSKMTGVWVRDGFTVVLRARNGVELARRTYVIKV